MINNMKAVYVGIDVGSNGGIFAFNDRDEVITKEAVPQLKNSGGVDFKKLYSILKRIGTKAGHEASIHVGIEDVHSLFGMSAKSNFSFGFIKGLKVGMLEALNYNYELVTPKNWQKKVWLDRDIVKKDSGKGTDTKATSLNSATRIFPLVDFTKSERSSKPHDGIFDAALIAEYIRIVNT